MKHIRRKIVISLWLMVIGAFASVIGVFFAISTGKFGYMPDLYDLQNPVSKYASSVYDCKGNKLGTWSLSSSNRQFASYNELSPYLVQALVATEDVRFFEHSGVDYRALLRAVVKRGLFKNKNAGGGSTLTQQLAKQVYTNSVKTATSTTERLMQKPVEWVIAVQLERMFTKEEIITMYFNQYDFLYNANGIKMAAQTYFGKKPKDLTLSEAAIFVGMCKNASIFKPINRGKDGSLSVNERCLDRRNVVLDQMVKAGYISEAQATEAKMETLDLSHFQPKLETSHKEGKCLYVREYLRKILMAEKPKRSNYADWAYNQYYQDSLAWENDPLYGWCNKHTKRDGTHYNLYTDGLKVYTTIDPVMQEYAEIAMHEQVGGTMQSAFNAESRGCVVYPYNNRYGKEFNEKLRLRAMKQTQRWATMKAAGHSEEEIIASFNVPQRMKVYSESSITHSKDTTMTPLDSMNWSKHFVRSGFMCMENSTGYVKAYVGGLDFNYFQYDMVTQGRRQIGSTMKPMLYALAMQNGWTPCDKLLCKRKVFHVKDRGRWIPRGSATGTWTTLKWGLQNSNNWMSALLIEALRPAQFITWLHEFGITNSDIPESEVVCLGPIEISIAEMVGAYSAFPNKGVRKVPVLVTRITDNEGNVLADVSNGIQPVVHEMLSEEASYKMIDIMRAVIRGGTGKGMHKYYGGDIAGKTGTTNNNSDAWFMCYTPSLTMGAWVGGEERYIHLSSGYLGQGGRAALPVCGKFLSRVYSDSKLGYSSSEKFDIPEGFDFCSEYDPENETAENIEVKYKARKQASTNAANRANTQVQQHRSTSSTPAKTEEKVDDYVEGAPAGGSEEGGSLDDLLF